MYIFQLDVRKSDLYYTSRFSYLRSEIAQSHTSCPISFNLINLPPEMRFVLQLTSLEAIADSKL